MPSAPGAKHLAYTLSVPRSADDEPGGSFSEIWLIHLETGVSTRFTRQRGSASSTRFTPDARFLAYLDDSEQATDGDADDDGFRCSPDGTVIAFTARDPKVEAEKTPAKKAGRDWVIRGEERDHRLLWIADVNTGEIRRLFDKTLHVSEFAWSPDGGTIAFTASESSTIDASMMFSRLYRVPAAGGTPEVVCATEGKLGNAVFSPDGSKLAWRGAVNLSDSLAQSIFVLPVDGASTARNITEKWEASVSDIDWVDDGRIVASCSEGVYTTISLVDVTTTERTMLIAGAPSTRGCDWDRTSRSIAMSGSTPEHPSELFVVSLDDPAPRRLTFHNPVLEGRSVATQGSIEWESADGVRIEGMVTVSAEFDPDTRYPLIANPHGGPEGADRFSWDTWPQLLAARGYIVFQPDYRGSAGRGPNWTAGDHGDLGGPEFIDLLTGIDALVERGYVDAERVGIGGWSYGGYFTALGATHHSHRFKAAVMGAGIANWTSFTGSTDIPYENSHTHWNRRLNEHADVYRKGSPLSGIQKSNTPTLILHGQDDARVPVSQSHEMYQALKGKGVPVQLVVYPRNGHGVRERAHRIDLTTRMLEWFDRYLK